MQTAKWDDFRLLLALYRTGSLKAAAGQLGVNISTVSRRLDVLEASVETHLFDRTPDGTRATAAAEQLVPFAETMEQAAMGMVHTLEGLEVEPEGTVRITAPPGFVDHFLAPAMKRLHGRYPKIRLELLSSIGYADLTRREADIALRAVRPVVGDLVSTLVGEYSTCVVGAPGYLKRLGRLANTKTSRWVTWGEDLSHLVESRWIQTHVPDDQVVLRTSSMTALIQAVRGGLGLMLAPEPFATLRGLAPAELGGSLRKEVALLPKSELWLVGHRALRKVPRVAAVWEFLLDEFRP